MSVERVVRVPARSAALLGVLTLSLLAGCARERANAAALEAAPAPLAVRVARAALVTESTGEDSVGTVRARTSAEIASSVIGRVRELPVTLGTRVRRGELLVRLWAGEIDAKADQARAVLGRADTELERARALRRTDAISQAALDAIEAERRVADAALMEASAMRGYTALRAPFDGVVTAKAVDVGDVAIPGRPLLTLEDPSALRLEVAVAETSARALPAGARTTVRVDALARDLDATVVEVSPTADPASRTVLVKLDLATDPELRAGMFGRVRLAVAPSRALVVPREAVVQRGQLDEVVVVDRGRARLRLVRTGATSERGTVILGGLDEGETVVASDVARIVDDQPLEAKQ